ncbi:MAG TPA: hypothetical protein VFU55_00605 [Terracidiphilus sp.]|nr:hypothetical protein [Terracidiphilus sp.]
MGNALETRQTFSDARFEELKRTLKQSPEICADKACVYATGSFGRREASKFSDCDLFVVSLGVKKEDPLWLTNLDGILIKADLIVATKELGFPPFSRDGKFLEHHTAENLISTTGTEDDDARNTFTARLLLLLESNPLIGSNVHKKIIDDVIAKYWKEFPDHADFFMPAYLANDILRYWRTLCLNYEARTSEKTPEDRAKRKLTNYKLKHSRMLTCYSALLFLLDVYVKKNTVTVADAREMVSLTPTNRIRAVRDNSTNERLTHTTSELLELYEQFLSVTNSSERDLLLIFSDDGRKKSLQKNQSRFGELLYEALRSIGEENRFYRRLIV